MDAPHGPICPRCGEDVASDPDDEHPADPIRSANRAYRATGTALPELRSRTLPLPFAPQQTSERERIMPAVERYCERILARCCGNRASWRPPLRECGADSRV